MARPVSDRVRWVGEQLRRDVSTAVFAPGDAFPSARALARRYEVSYQTAHRLVRQMVEEGLLVTRQGSGTYVAAEAVSPRRAVLRFHPRAKRKRSFGAHLKRLLETQLAKQGVECVTAWGESGRRHTGESFTVAWERPDLAQTLTKPPGYALLLNDSRVQGLAAGRIDTIGVDDFSGGASAGELAAEQAAALPARQRRVAVLAADHSDPRSNDRVAGFRSVLSVPTERCVVAGGWTDADAFDAAERVLRLNPDFVFCCNDRLAQGLLRRCRGEQVQPPAVIGFDNAPIAEQLGLTTVGIPWREFVAAAVDVIVRRLGGDRSVARRQVFTPLPVLRSSHRPGAPTPQRTS